MGEKLRSGVQGRDQGSELKFLGQLGKPSKRAQTISNQGRFEGGRHHETMGAGGRLSMNEWESGGAGMGSRGGNGGRNRFPSRKEAGSGLRWELGKGCWGGKCWGGSWVGWATRRGRAPVRVVWIADTPVKAFGEVRS